MLELKDFLAAGYTCKELPSDMALLKKKKQGYTVKIIVSRDDTYIEPFVDFDSSPVSTVSVQVDNRTSIQDIEDFFEVAYNAFVKSNKE